MCLLRGSIETIHSEFWNMVNIYDNTLATSTNQNKKWTFFNNSVQL